MKLPCKDCLIISTCSEKCDVYYHEVYSADFTDFLTDYVLEEKRCPLCGHDLVQIDSFHRMRCEQCKQFLRYDFNKVGTHNIFKINLATIMTPKNSFMNVEDTIKFESYLDLYILPQLIRMKITSDKKIDEFVTKSKQIHDFVKLINPNFKMEETT